MTLDPAAVADLESDLTPDTPVPTGPGDGPTAEEAEPDPGRPVDNGQRIDAAQCYLAAANSLRGTRRWVEETGPRMAQTFEGGGRYDEVMADVAAAAGDPIGFHYGRDDNGHVKIPSGWPWPAGTFAPAPDPVGNLAKALALVAAELAAEQAAAAGPAPAPTGQGAGKRVVLFPDEKPCPDCQVAVGDLHEDGCDVARCTSCHGQRLACGCETGCGGTWTGKWPGALECERLGLWAVLRPGRGWVPCPAGSPDAVHDLNRLTLMAARGELVWDAPTETFVRPGETVA